MNCSSKGFTASIILVDPYQSVSDQQLMWIAIFS